MPASVSRFGGFPLDFRRASSFERTGLVSLLKQADGNGVNFSLTGPFDERGIL